MFVSASISVPVNHSSYSLSISLSLSFSCLSIFMFVSAFISVPLTHSSSPSLFLSFTLLSFSRSVYLYVYVSVCLSFFLRISLPLCFFHIFFTLTAVSFFSFKIQAIFFQSDQDVLITANILKGCIFFFNQVKIITANILKGSKYFFQSGQDYHC